MNHLVAQSARPAGTDAVLVGRGPGWHDEVYRVAAGDLSRVPWASGRACGHVVDWLNTGARGVVRTGSRAVVVGCGLGDDVRELENRGYDACGFDYASTAVEWARVRHPDLASKLRVEDLFDLPTRYRHRFELVVESYTLPSLEPSQWHRAAGSIAQLVAPRGHVLVVTGARSPDKPMDEQKGPPWPMTAAELVDLFAGVGLSPVQPLESLEESEKPFSSSLRGVFARSSA